MTLPVSPSAVHVAAAGASGPLDRFATWFAEAVQHAIGSLQEQAAMAPPPIGVQPYRDRPSKLR